MENQYKYPALPNVVPNSIKLVFDVPTVRNYAKDSNCTTYTLTYPANSKVRYVMVYSAKNAVKIDVNNPNQIIDKFPLKEKEDPINIVIQNSDLINSSSYAVTFIDFYGNESLPTVLNTTAEIKILKTPLKHENRK
jgi:hypothetical protein